jgi:nucleotide-binding universal stress UspA family protein
MLLMGVATMAWFPKRRVVAPIDFSDESFAALEVALQVAESPSDVHVVHVLQDMAPLEAGEVWAVPDPQGRIVHITRALQERLSDARFAGVHIEVLMGEPAHGIASYAQDAHAELIVIPSHGRTGITRLLIGSVAERVVRLAHCPVLVLRK